MSVCQLQQFNIKCDQIGTWNYLPLHGENKIAMPVLSLRKKLESIL